VSSRKREKLRTDPDFEVFVPESTSGPTASNQFLIVVPTPDDTFVATWTQASFEDADDQRVVSSRSTDRGETWTEPIEIDGPGSDDTDGSGLASWGIPIVAPTGKPDDSHRIYYFYNKNVGIDDAREDTTGVLRCRYSDDDGQTWSDETIDHDIASSAISHPDPEVPQSWNFFQAPVAVGDDTALAGFTHWASDTVDDAHLFDRQSEVRFLRFDNLDAADPTDVTTTTLPDTDHGLQVPHPERPGISVAQEPSVRRLVDDRLICTVRTMQGQVYFALSGDDGRTWDTPRPLHYGPDERRPMENPITPCPLYRYGDKLLFVFYNNDGTGHGGTGPTDTRRNRTPAWYTVGETIDHHTHPVAFDEPRILLDNDRVPFGPVDRTEVATYTSFFEHNGRAYFWYPDRKHFLLGKDLTARLSE
jgi:hypothetical protein